MNIRSFLCPLVVGLAGILSLAASSEETVRLQKVYASGRISLDAAAEYGKDTDWVAVLYNPFTDITAAPDGTAFAASSRQHKIFHFDAGGRLIGSFGQKGQGPGDLTGPGELSVLDGEFLVVGENPETRRISLFRLDGSFVKLLGLRQGAFRVVALRDGKIAYTSVRSQMTPQSVMETTERVFIRDVETGTEVEVAEFHDSQRFIRKGNSFRGTQKFNAAVAHISRSFEGDLLVGGCFEPVIRVYSPDGEKIKDVPLDMVPIRATRSFLMKYRDTRVRAWKEDPRVTEEGLKIRIKNFDETLFEDTLDKILPLYRDFYTDSEGNWLFFLMPLDFDESGPTIRAYASDGKPIGDVRLEPGRWGVEVDVRKKHFAFTDSGIFILVEDTKASDYTLRIIRVDPAELKR